MGWWSEKDNVVFGEQFRQLGILGGVAPPRPHGLDGDPLGYVEDEIYVGIVVIV